MTEDEKRQQKAMLLLDFQEAQTNLTHLTQEAGRMSTPIRKVGDWLSNAETTDYSYDQRAREKDAQIRANLELYRQGLNFDAAVALMDEIKDARALLDRLEKRKAEFGLK
jgi:hypothetical protein